VHLLTQSELLLGADSLRELILDLSKKSKAVPAVCPIIYLMNDQVSSLQRKGIAVADL